MKSESLPKEILVKEDNQNYDCIMVIFGVNLLNVSKTKIFHCFIKQSFIVTEKGFSLL